MKNTKRAIVIIALLLLLLATIGIGYLIVHLKMNNAEKITTKNMNIALSLEDEIKPNTAWCGTFNLIWNDLKNNLAKQDIVFIAIMTILYR